MPFFAPGLTVNIGSIIKTGSAPTGSGTWAKCDGSVLKQSLFPGLFSVIGHSFLNFNVNENLAAPVNFSIVSWIGDRFLGIASGGTQTYKTTDNTWAAAGILTAGVTNPIITSDGAGTVIVWHNSSTSCQVSSDYGQTWTAQHLPSIGLNHMIWNGNYFIGFRDNANDNYYSPDGIAWTTSVAVLPFTAQYQVMFDGGEIVIAGLNTAVAANRQIARTSDPFGAVWALVAVPQGGFGQMLGANKNDNTIVIGSSGLVATGAPNFVKGITKDRYGTVQRANYSYTVGPPTSTISITSPIPGSIIHNGYIFAQLAGNNALNISTDGLIWNAINFLSNFDQSMNAFGMLAQGALGSVYYTSDQAADPATGNFMAGYGGNQQFCTWLFSPTCNLATEFCIPYFADSRYIRIS